ncbi:MAG: hypothetical protein KC649_01420 [Candidatus Omnitrophica bacterium]|nr:hypothetical protein [Candidatus Omnitrophota bacterium]
MKIKASTFLTITAVITMLTAPVCMAFDDMEVQYVFGEVKSVNKNQITVTGYDYQTEQDVDVKVKINADTQVSGVDLSNPANGLWAEVNYFMEGDEKVAVSIAAETDDEIMSEE